MDSGNRQHTVIVGGGFGGITAAKQLKKADAEVTLIDRSNHHLFQPLLDQVATAALSPGDIAAPNQAKAVADIKGFKLSGVFAWFMWSFVHILQLMCFHNKTRVFLEWIWYYFTFKRGVRLITDRTDCPYCVHTEKSTDELLAFIDN